MNYESDSLKEQNELSLAIQKRKIYNQRNLEFQNELFDLNRKIGTIVLKASRKTIGRIAQVNNEILQMTHYKKEKILNANISILFPQVMDESSHNACLDHFFTERNSSSFINQRNNLWVKDYNGYIILVDFYVQPFYDQIHGLQLIAYIKQTDFINIKDLEIQSSELFTILTDSNGKIQSGSQNFSNFLQFTNSYDLRNSDINIFQLCSQLNELISNKSIQVGTTTDLVLSEFNIEIFQQEIPLYNQSIKKGANIISANYLESYNDIYSLNEDDEMSNTQSEINQVSPRKFSFFRQKTVRIHIKGDMRYFGGVHKYFNFGVFYFTFAKKEKIKVMPNLEIESSSEQLDALKDQIDLEGSVTASSASSSHSRNFKKINNLKSEYEIQKAPRIIGIFQKIFIAYFAIFLALSIGIIMISNNYMLDVMEDIDQYQTSRLIFYELIEMRKNVRELILLQNNQTGFTSNILNNRTLFILYSINSKIQFLNTLTNSINDYVLKNADETNNNYAQTLQSEYLQLQNLNQNGSTSPVPYRLVPGLQQIISKVQLVVSINNMNCNCFFRPSDLLKNYQFQQFERDFYFVDQNLVDILGRSLFQKADDLENVIQQKSNTFRITLLYLSMPGVFISILCSILFFPVLIKMTNNRKYVIQLLARIKIKTSQVAEKKLDKFLKDLVQNKNKKREQQNYYEDDEYYQNTLMINQQLVSKPEIISESSLAAYHQDDSLIGSTNLNNKKDEETSIRLEQSMTSQQLINAKTKTLKGLSKQQRDNNQPNAFKDNQEMKLLMINKQIDEQYSRQKCTNVFKIFVLSLIYSSFFISIYFMNAIASNNVSQTIDTIKQIDERGACISAVPLYVRQRLISNQSVYVGYLDITTIDSLFNYCLMNVNSVTDYRKNIPLCLQDQGSLMNIYEDSNLCTQSDLLVSQDSTLSMLSTSSCSYDNQGIFLKGLQQSYSYLLAQLRQFQQQYEMINPSAVNLQSNLISSQFIEIQDSVTLNLKPVLDQLNQEVYSAIKSYYNGLKERSIIFFIAFVVVLFLAIILIIVYLLKIIQRELYFNKKVIKFIPIEELQRKSMLKLLKTLNF